MRKFCCAVLAAVAAASATAAAEPAAPRQTELIYRLRQDCGSCHGMTLKGGLGPPLLPAAIGDRSNEVLTNVILYGVPGTPMPPWDFEISQDEARWLVHRLKEGLDGRQ
jgi:cytochrome c55X